MINLIPQAAKKSLLTEYWIRTVTVWFLTWGVVLIAGVAVMLPSFLLLQFQVNAYEESAANADKKNADFESLTDELKKASNQAKVMSEQLTFEKSSTYVALIRGFESSAISITNIGFTREEGVVTPLRVSGIASDRQALAAFREGLLASPQVAGVDLPISNLAKDKQIPFEMQIEVKPSTP